MFNALIFISIFEYIYIFCPVPLNLQAISFGSETNLKLNIGESDEGPSLDNQRASSPTPSGISMKSDRSIDHPPELNKGKSVGGPSLDNQRASSPTLSVVSMKSDRSIDHPPDLKKGKSVEGPSLDNQRAFSPTPSGLSLSDRSIDHPPDLRRGESVERPSLDNQRAFSSTPSGLSLSDRSIDHPPDLRRGESAEGPSRDERPSNAFVKDEVLDFNNGESEESIQRKLKQAAKKKAKDKLTKNLKKRIIDEYGIRPRNEEIETDLFITGGQKDKKGGREIQTGAKDTRQTTYDEIFQSKGSIKKVLTKGLGGIGKTFQAQTLMLDWGRGRIYPEIDMLFKINLGKLQSTEIESLEELLDHLLGKDSEHRTSDYKDYKIAFVLDGLDKCQLPLDFDPKNDLTDTRKKDSVDRLLTNLIKGNLLPSACLWILTQHSAADKIPAEFIDRVTECQDSVKRRQKLIKSMKKRYTNDFQNNKDLILPNPSNTEHIEKESSDALSNVKAISYAVADIFKESKTVLTIVDACIGKTIHAQKFTREWAGAVPSRKTRLFNLVSRMEPDTEIVFHLTSHQLSKFKEEKKSLIELLNDVFTETEQFVISDFEKYKLIIVLDGLDGLPLDFGDSVKTLSDVREAAPVSRLLSNLIRGNLLPSALLWILSRPLEAKQIPSKFIDRQTVIREKPDFASQKKLKDHLIKQFQRVSEGITQQGKSALLHEIYTELYIIKGESDDVIGQNESRRVQAASFESGRQETAIKHHDIFKSGQNREIRSVLTNGIAGSGKTMALQKYMLDWAEGAVNQGIYFLFTFPFRELNLMNTVEHSFEEIINSFFPEMKTSEITNYRNYKILIVLDGFDECRLDLNFSEIMDWSDMKKPAPLNVLLKNLIRGNLLPGAQLWITARPASSRNIPPECIDLVTEVRGFNDLQREQYFRKRYDPELAERIFSHIKTSRALYIMCYIPVFCWITSTVLEDLMHSEENVQHMPKTLTDMYICFLLLQCKVSIVKFQGGAEKREDVNGTESYWTKKNKETVLSLGKLAYEELKRGNLVFIEEDLKQREMDITACAVYSGLFTQNSMESYDLIKQNLYSFVHLSIQEFLAAVYAFVTFVNTGENVLTEPAITVGGQSDFYICAVDKALENDNGDWDMFLRFLLGLSLETNQKPLHDLLVSQAGRKQPETNKDTIEYIKTKIDGDINAEKRINLFHCLNELNDHSLVKEIKDHLQKQSLTFEKFTRPQWSALMFVLLTSDADLDVFDLKKYVKSEEVLEGMLPLVKVAKTALLNRCDLTARSCEGLASSILKSSSSNLTVLDLSHNDIKDAGVEKLAESLRSKCCRLEVLKLSYCQVTKTGCLSLASALELNHSQLQELDLSYNYPEKSGEQRLSAIAADPKTSLKTLRIDHGGECRLKPAPKKYGIELKLDGNKAGERLVLSEDGRTARRKKAKDIEGFSPDHKRTSMRPQVLCVEELPDLCYWEVEWSGHVGVAVVDSRIDWKGRSCGFGTNKMSWSLVGKVKGNKVKYESWTDSASGKPCKTTGPLGPRLGVFLDRDRGMLTFYDVSSEKQEHIHTFNVRFDGRKLLAGFWLGKGHVSLCEI
ncbi:uncharacterized protein LOC130388684 isoform X2 [Gadus chalcogrammus]|uniref:uncharacterized protein LOC130388684 isoform X2 n=1 Tax=Gadus chalcogrammus TaxID=1042646 RepID=UPI0024C2D185|nr:uncharacterized protein LOC130388684 isoform X2 [Gadus chalcogrammus]